MLRHRFARYSSTVLDRRLKSLISSSLFTDIAGTASTCPSRHRQPACVGCHHKRTSMTDPTPRKLYSRPTMRHVLDKVRKPQIAYRYLQRCFFRTTCVTNSTPLRCLYRVVYKKYNPNFFHAFVTSRKKYSRLQPNPVTVQCTLSAIHR